MADAEWLVRVPEVRTRARVACEPTWSGRTSDGGGGKAVSVTLYGLLQLATLEDIAELGYACSQRLRDDTMCDQVAVGLVHWPSGSVRCCSRHVQRWHEVANAMGIANLQVTPLPVRRAVAFTDDLTVRAGLLELE